MGKSRVDLKLSFAVFFLIAFSSLLATWAVYKDGSVDQVKDNPIRTKLLALKDLAGPIAEPTNSTQYSNVIFDVDVKENFYGQLPFSDLVTPAPSGEYTFTWRIKVPFAASFSVDVPDFNGAIYTLSLVRRDGLPIFTQTESFVVPGAETLLTPDIYIMNVTSSFPLNSIKFRFTHNATKDPDSLGAISNLKTIHLKLDPFSLKDLKRMVSSAERSTTTEVVKMPGGRVKGEIVDVKGKKIADVRVGLSGRGRVHITWFPSVDIKIQGGKSFLGMPSFKLYRFDSKKGILDMVFLSVMRDMGYLVPRQEVIRLMLNNEDMGPHILMETSSPAMFVNQHRAEGNIVGLNTDKLFFDYPYGAVMDSNYFYKLKNSVQKKSDTRFFLSDDFTKRLERDSFAKLLAFSSLYILGHGLGVDDLRFYEDPASNLFSPIPRDLDPWIIGLNLPSYLSHFAWLPYTPHLTVWPTKRLLDSGYEFTRDIDVFAVPTVDFSTPTGIADIHYAVGSFLTDPENMALANQYLHHYANNKAMFEKIKTRLMKSLNSVLASTGEKILDEQLRDLEVNGLPSFRNIINDQLQSGPLRLKALGKTWEWNIRSARLLRADLSPSLFAPVAIRQKGYKDQLILSFLAEKSIVGILAEEGLDKGLRSYTQTTIEDDGAIDASRLTSVVDPEWYGGKTLDDIVVYLKTHSTSEGKALLLFLVRNATNDRIDYEIVFRDSLVSLTPVVNRLFRIDNTGSLERVTTKQIMLNHFTRGERMRLLAFEVPLGKQSSTFYTMKTPKGAFFLFPPYMYVPTQVERDKRTDMDLRTKLPHGLVDRGDKVTATAGSIIKVDNDIILPRDKDLYVEEGVTFLLAPRSSIKVTGNVYMKGTKEQPIRFDRIGSDNWGGFYVAGNASGGNTVVLSNVLFSNFGDFPKTRVGDNLLNGGITFQNTRAIMDNVIINGSMAEDGINLISSTAWMRNITVVGMISDGIDLDFTNAYFEDLLIKNTEGDGLDISNSLVRCMNSRFVKAKDKGISVGEMSNVFVEDSIFEDNKMGIANKDQSRLSVRGTEFKSNDAAIVEFIKKPYFGKPASDLADNLYINNKSKYQWLGFYSY